MFSEEVLHDDQWGDVIDIVAGDGVLALAAVCNRIPYSGLVFTQHHTYMLMNTYTYL